MILCPICSREISNVQICKCGTDLKLLQQIKTRADYLFNQALNAYKSGSLSQAIEYLHANAEIIPDDPEARLFQVKLYCELERWDEAQTFIQALQRRYPNHQDVKTLQRVIEEHITKNEEEKTNE